MVSAILVCRGYRRAIAAYDNNQIGKEQTELLDMVDAWRREEDERDG